MGKKIVPPTADADAVVTPSSGNVFADLGLGPGEAAVMGLRADLMARLRLLVQNNGGPRRKRLRNSALPNQG